MSWTSLVVGDIGYLRALLPDLLENLQLPQDSIYDVWNLFVEYPDEWSLIVKKYHTSLDDMAIEMPHPCLHDVSTALPMPSSSLQCA